MSDKTIDAIRPNCPICKLPMRLVGSGVTVRKFYCSDCHKIELVEKEEESQDISPSARPDECN